MFGDKGLASGYQASLEQDKAARYAVIRTANGGLYDTRKWHPLYGKAFCIYVFLLFLGHFFIYNFQSGIKQRPLLYIYLSYGQKRHANVHAVVVQLKAQLPHVVPCLGR